MNKYKFLYLFWLLPGYFLFLALYQTSVYFGLRDTYNNGSSYIAKVIDFEIEQVAAQTNGSAIIQFQTTEKDTIQQLLALPIQAAEKVGKAGMVPIRYKKDAFVEIVIMPIYKMQKKFVLTNIAMAGVAFIITFFVGFIAHRYANKKIRKSDRKMVIERID